MIVDQEGEDSQIAESEYSPRYPEPDRDFLVENDQIQDLEELF